MRVLGPVFADGQPLGRRRPVALRDARRDADAVNLGVNVALDRVGDDQPARVEVRDDEQVRVGAALIGPPVDGALGVRLKRNRRLPARPPHRDRKADALAQRPAQRRLHAPGLADHADDNLAVNERVVGPGERSERPFQRLHDAEVVRRIHARQ
jgi:hypothetical protein